MKPKIALFDLDDSLADYTGAIRRDLELMRSPSEPEMPEDIWNHRYPAYIKQRIRTLRSVPGWWLNLEPIPAGMYAVELAKEMGYEVHILSKGPTSQPTAWKEKVEWCQKYLKADIHLVTDKSLIYGTFLYDDYVAYMNSWLVHRPRGLGIMPKNSINKDYSHPQVIHWDGENKDELFRAMKIAYDREIGESLNL